MSVGVLSQQLVEDFLALIYINILIKDFLASKLCLISRHSYHESTGQLSQHFNQLDNVVQVHSVTAHTNCLTSSAGSTKMAILEGAANTIQKAMAVVNEKAEVSRVCITGDAND